MTDILKRYKNYANLTGNMSIKGRLINMPETIWTALEKDADRCKRSVTKQIEAILSVYFELGDVEINREVVNKIRKREVDDVNLEDYTFDTLEEARRAALESEKLRPEDAAKFDENGGGQKAA